MVVINTVLYTKVTSKVCKRSYDNYPDDKTHPWVHMYNPNAEYELLTDVDKEKFYSKIGT